MSRRAQKTNRRLLNFMASTVFAVLITSPLALANAAEVDAQNSEAASSVIDNRAVSVPPIDAKEVTVPSNSHKERSALGETPGPGPGGTSRAFIYVNGKGLRANYAQVGWRGASVNPMTDHMCGGKFDLIWRNAQNKHRERHGQLSNCTPFFMFNIPGHYITFDLKHASFKANSKVCGRYHLRGQTSPWACITMKP